MHDSKNVGAVANPETSSIDKTDYEKAISLHENISDEVFDKKDETKLLRKMDSHLLPFLALLYLLSFLDRANIGNAKLAGLEKDLNMTGKWDYNVSSSWQSRMAITNNRRLLSPSSSPSTSRLRSHPTWP